jgi:hypothetical protein
MSRFNELRNREPRPRIFVDCFLFARFENNRFYPFGVSLLKLLERYYVVIYVPATYYVKFQELKSQNLLYGYDRAALQVVSSNEDLFTLLKEPNNVGLFMSPQCSKIMERLYTKNTLLNISLIQKVESFKELESRLESLQ